MKILHPSRGLDDTKDMSRVTEEYFLIYGNRNNVACLQSGEIVVAKDNFHPNYSVCQSVRQGFQV